jgi:hypothetical protein
MEKPKEVTGFDLGFMPYCPIEVVHKWFLKGFRWVACGVAKSENSSCPVRMWIFYSPNGRQVATFEVFHSENALQTGSSSFAKEFIYDSSIFELRSIENKFDIGEKFDILPLLMPLYICLQ